MGIMSKLYKGKFHRCTERLDWKGHLQDFYSKLRLQAESTSKLDWKSSVRCSQSTKLSKDRDSSASLSLFQAFALLKAKSYFPLFSTGVFLAAACNCCPLQSCTAPLPHICLLLFSNLCLSCR